MKYFGVPTCPYCKKRVNLIRTWSLKRQGEYQCPRCRGISNIYLSPLIYVAALLAVFAGGAMYFFHKFVLDDVDLNTLKQVFLPFAAFFVISLFMVYLEKPVIKKVSRAEVDRKKRGRRNFEERRGAGPAGQMFYEEDEYVPQGDYRTGPLPQMDLGPQPAPTKIAPERFSRTPPQAAPAGREPVRESSFSQVPEPVRRPVRRPEQKPVERPARPAVERPAPKAAERPVQPAAAPVEVRPSVPNITAAAEAPASTVTAAPVTVPASVPTEVPAAPVSTAPAASAAVSNDDFFAKYDDPDYVERRLRELNEKNGGKQ